jgi:cellulose synthase/poly-beta-1,6-N-acetylglucosamine synthase-like glycosyltransferase
MDLLFKYFSNHIFLLFILWIITIVLNGFVKAWATDIFHQRKARRINKYVSEINALKNSDYNRL